MTDEASQAGRLRLRPPVNPIEKRAVLWWTLSSIAFFLPILIALGVGMYLWEAARTWILLVFVVAAVFALVSTAVEPLWRYRVHRWEASEDAVYALTGWIVREWRVAPISRIQTVDSVRGPIEQMLGLATLRVTTASSKGAIKISGLDAEVAADLAERLTVITQRTPGDAT